MSACMTHSLKKNTSRPAKPAANQGLFTVGYESAGRTS